MDFHFGENNISSFFLVRHLISVWPLIQKGIWIFPKVVRRKLKRNFRGSLRDPLLYLAIFSLFLFGFTFLWAPTSLSSLSNNLSFFLISQNLDKPNKDNVFLAQERVGELNSPSFYILQKNSLVGISAPFVVFPETLGTIGADIPEEELQETRKEIIEYIVQSGDTLSSLAKRFNISANTITWANNLSTNSQLKKGQKLVILPTSGVLHYVKTGETLSQIAKKYQGDIDEIIAFNELSGQEIFTGDILIIPGGIMPQPTKQTKKPSQPLSTPQVPLADSYFIFPTQGKISQGLHWYNAVDIAASCGTLVYAAAQGNVLKTKFSNSGLGNYIAISHPNGAVTYYGHLQNISVSPGAQVSQGQIIALMGGSPGTQGAGISTGCHVHFEVRGARNPFAR